MTANEGIDQVELDQPRDAVKAAGETPVLVSSEPGAAQAFNHLDKGDVFDMDTTVAEASPADYDGLVLPGGVANPETLTTDDDAVRFVKDFVAAGKPVAAVMRRGPRSRPGCSTDAA
jgi:protease I